MNLKNNIQMEQDKKELKEGATYIIQENKYSVYVLPVKCKVLEITDTTYYFKNEDTCIKYRQSKEFFHNRYKVVEEIIPESLPDGSVKEERRDKLTVVGIATGSYDVETWHFTDGDKTFMDSFCKSVVENTGRTVVVVRGEVVGTYEPELSVTYKDGLSGKYEHMRKVAEELKSQSPITAEQPSTAKEYTPFTDLSNFVKSLNGAQKLMWEKVCEEIESQKKESEEKAFNAAREEWVGHNGVEDKYKDYGDYRKSLTENAETPIPSPLPLFTEKDLKMAFDAGRETFEKNHPPHYRYIDFDYWNMCFKPKSKNNQA